MASYLPKRFFVTACFFAALALSAKADSFNSLYVFGDSLSDAGNAFIATGGAEPAVPYSGGRFSNGPVWVQDVATTLGLPAVTPSLAGGTDYAVGSALSGSANPADLTEQLAAFKASNPVVNPNGLYMIWIGSNDLNAILASNPGSATAAAEALAVVGNIDSAITTLAGDGAKNFLIVTVPDLGKTPAAIAAGSASAAAASGLSLFFDESLVTGATTTGAADGVNLNILDTYSLVDAITANPAAFGLSNVTQPCLTGEVNYAGGTPCANPNQYLFWDQEHPTAAGQAIVAAAALQSVPEPSAAVLLLGAGSAWAVWAARRRRRVC
jgi:phospholipase/lecithinase/hemolysin